MNEPTQPEPQRCEPCDGSGVISYNPNLNPNEFAGVASARCKHCGGTGTTKGDTEPQQRAVEWVNARIYPHGCDPSRPVVGLLSEEHALELAERCDAATAQRDQALDDHRETLEELESCTVSLATVQAERDEMRRRWHKSRRACRQQGRGMAMHARVMQLQAAETLLMRQQRDEAFDERRAAQAEAGRFRAELENFINANPRKWEDQADQFEQWVKSRSRAALKEGQP